MKKKLTGKKKLDIYHTERIQVANACTVSQAVELDRRLVKGTDGYYVWKNKMKTVTVNSYGPNVESMKIFHKVREEFVQCYHCQLYGHLAGSCPRKFKYYVKSLLDKESQAFTELIFKNRRFPMSILRIMLKKIKESKVIRVVKKLFKKFNGGQEGLSLINKRWDEIDAMEWTPTALGIKVKEIDDIYSRAKQVKQEIEKKNKIEFKEITTPVQFKKADYRVVKQVNQLELDKQNYEIAKKVISKEDSEYVKKYLEEEQLNTLLNCAVVGVLSDCADRTKCQKCGYNCERTCQTPEAIVAPYANKVWHTNQRGKQYFTIEEKPVLQSFKRLLTTDKIPEYFDKNCLEGSYLVQNDKTLQLSSGLRYPDYC